MGFLFTGKDITIPAINLVEDTKVVVQMREETDTVIIDDWTLTKVDRKNKADVSSFVATFIGSNGLAALQTLSPLILLITIFEWLFGLGGQILSLSKKAEFDEDAIKTSMIGRELSGSYYRDDYGDPAGEEVVLKAENLCHTNQLDHFSFELHKGEILGIGGLSHCGMHTLGKVLFAAEKCESGEFSVHGKKVNTIAEAMKMQMGYVAKDRDTESLNTEASIKDNIAIAGLDKFAVSGFLILPGNEKKYVQKQIDGLSIKCTGADQYVSALSGGNKQKVAFGKWLGRESEILILDCPTRGVDIGVKQAMYQLMYRMRQEGKSILLISEEMAELIGMSDRILVMKDGALKKELFRSKELSEADVIQYMI